MTSLPPFSCTILGGPNGSGKSSLYSSLKPPGEFVNADVVAMGIDPAKPESVSLAAGRLVIRRLDELISARSDFTYETTLSSRQAILVMERARTAGYTVSLVFVALNNPDLNVLRVRERVSLGGHPIPESHVRRRYEKALARLSEAIPLADASLVYDNSGRSPELLLRIAGKTIEENNLDEAQAFHVKVAEAVAKALGVGEDVVFREAKPT